MKISEEVGSKYRFIILSGQRVTQLQRGAKPRVDTGPGWKNTRVAIEELKEGKLTFHKISQKDGETESDSSETLVTES